MNQIDFIFIQLNEGKTLVKCFYIIFKLRIVCVLNLDFDGIRLKSFALSTSLLEKSMS